MTPDKLAAHQLTAAWIAAGAAVVQAVGAVAAIWASVSLARRAERLSARLQREGVEREKRAEAAAVIRAEQAEAKADARLKSDRAAEQNELISLIESEAQSVVEDIGRSRAGINIEYPGTITGGFQSARARKFKDQLVSYKDRARVAALALKIDQLREYLDAVLEDRRSRSYADFGKFLDDTKSSVQALASDIRKFRSPVQTD